MKEKNERSKNKKTALYVGAIAALALVAAITLTVVFAGNTQQNAVVPENPSQSTEKPNDSSGEPSEPSKPSDTDKPNEDVNPPVTPSSTKIVFAVPVENGRCVKEYTASSVVYNQTLNTYTGHMGMDFAADENAAVLAAYDGTVLSVTTSVLTGTTVTIDHGDGLVSVYNSIEPNEDLVEGKSVLKGEKIGVVSDNNKQEKKDGAHLHFEVYKNDERVSPIKYLEGVEK